MDLAKLVTTVTPGNNPPLSPREQQVVTLAAKGMPQKAIASSLGISPSTVETYLLRAREKCDCDNTLELLVRISMTRQTESDVLGWLYG